MSRLTVGTVGGGELTIKDFAQNYTNLRAAELELQKFMKQYRDPIRLAVFKFAAERADTDYMNEVCPECQIRIDPVNVRTDAAWVFTIICGVNCAANAVSLFVPLTYLAKELGLKA